MSPKNKNKDKIKKNNKKNSNNKMVMLGPYNKM